MKLYLAVTPDKYELPLFVSEYPREIAQKFNTTSNNVLTCISKNKSGRYKGQKFIRIEVD